MKIIIYLIIVLMLIGIVAAITTIDNIPTSKFTGQQKQKLGDVYRNQEKGMLVVDNYKMGADHVIISFKNTEWRLITSKDNFLKIIQ